VHLYSTVQYGKNTDFLDPIPEYIGRSRGTYEECRLDEFIGYRIMYYIKYLRFRYDRINLLHDGHITFTSVLGSERTIVMKASHSCHDHSKRSSLRLQYTKQSLARRLHCINCIKENLTSLDKKYVQMFTFVKCVE